MLARESGELRGVAVQPAGLSCETSESPVIIFDLTVRGCQERSRFCSRLKFYRLEISLEVKAKQGASESVSVPSNTAGSRGCFSSSFVAGENTRNRPVSATYSLDVLWEMHAKAFDEV